MALRVENNMIFLNENNSSSRIEEIRLIYESSFPADERMPFERVLQKRDAGVMRLLSVEDDNGELLGFANITLCLDVLALNYFAILPEKQGRGYGTAVIRLLRERYPDKNIWCYTGFLLDEELLKSDDGDVLELLQNIEVLVDGRFVDELKSAALLFRGSSNQRIIDVAETLKKGEVVLLPGKWERTMGSGDIYEA